MDLKRLIQERIEFLKKDELAQLAALETYPDSQPIFAAFGTIAESQARRHELQKLLMDAEKAANNVAPVIPGPLVQLPTNLEEMEAFHERLIQQGLHMFNYYSVKDTIQFFKNLQAYFVNLTAQQWNEGLIEKLEILERNNPDTPENVLVSDNVDMWLHQAHQNRATLADNCHILEQELNLKP